MIFKKRKEIAPILATVSMQAQRERLRVLKGKLSADRDALDRSTSEAKVIIAAVAAKLKNGLKKLDPTVGLFLTSKDEGVAFVDYRGEIIHANHAACELLNRTPSEIIKKRIDYILTGAKKKRISIEECSKLIVDRAKQGDCTYRELCDTARAAYILKTEAVAMHLDEPVCIVLKSGQSFNSLKVTISLLDTNPKELADVAFLCKIEQIAGTVPASLQAVEARQAVSLPLA